MRNVSLSVIEGRTGCVKMEGMKKRMCDHEALEEVRRGWCTLTGLEQVVGR